MKEDEKDKAQTELIEFFKNVGITFDPVETPYIDVSESPNYPGVWFVNVDGILRVQKPKQNRGR